MDELIKMSKTPWLMANLFLSDGDFLPGCQPYTIIVHQGVKIGLFGVCEKDWLGLISPLKV